MSHWALLASLVTALLLHPFAAPAGAADRPNVLFIAVDDLRPQLGCYGDKVVQSPNIDRLAARGLRFDRAYCQYPVCNPSRTSLLTGLRPDTTGVLDNTTFFRKRLPDVVTLPQLFRQQCYTTVLLGKIYHGAKDMEDPKAWDQAEYPTGTERGKKGEGINLTEGQLPWCRWLAAEGDDEDQPDGQFARAAIRFLEQKRDKPFFLALGFHKPHDPFVAPKRYFDLYPQEKLTLPQDPPRRSPEVAHAIPMAMKTEFDRFTDRERKEFLRAYHAGVSFTDAQVGKVLDALERLQLADRTVVVFFGDHGYHLGERGWWNKNTLFELSARVPLVVVAPGMKAKGKVCARLVELVDIYPTLVELCGLRGPEKLEGHSFAHLLDNPEVAGKKAAFTQVQRGQVAGYSVRTERWRYTEWDQGKAGAELYDHANDPQEYQNLADDARHADVVAELAKLLRKEDPAGETPRKLKVLVLQGSPRDRGLAHGKAMREQIHQLLKLWKADLATNYKMDADAFIQRFVKKTDFLTAMKKWTPELVEEVEGLAEGASVDFPTLYVFQLLDEVWANGEAVVAERCSSLGFSRNGKQPTTVAQNMDLPPFYDGFQLVLHIKHKDSDLESFVLTVPGLIGLNGVNNKSVTLCCNTLLQLSHCRDGLPVACIVRGVLQQRTQKEAAAFLHKVKHASGQNYILGGLDQAVDLECSANKVSPFAPKGREGAVWHTNHPLVNDDYDAKYRALLDKKEVTKKEENTRARLECLEKRLGQEAAIGSLDLIKDTLASRDSEAYPVSRPKGKQYAFTFASTIMVLAVEPEFHVAPGPPHATAYEKLSFSKRK